MMAQYIALSRLNAGKWPDLLRMVMKKSITGVSGAEGCLDLQQLASGDAHGSSFDTGIGVRLVLSDRASR